MRHLRMFIIKHQSAAIGNAYKLFMRFFTSIILSLILSLGLIISVSAEFYTDIDGNDRVVRLKVPFDSGNSILGAQSRGVISDEQNFYSLKSMNKYRIILNSRGNYDLYLVKTNNNSNSENNENRRIGELSLPITLRGESESPVYLTNAWYKGKIFINKSPSGTTAVNYTQIEEILPSVIGLLATENNSPASVKAAAVLLRSSLLCMNITAKSGENKKSDYYDLAAMGINYLGIGTEKDFINDAIKETEGEVLLDAYGNLACTSFSSAYVKGAFPFQLIGSKTNAWEKTLTFDDLARELKEAGYANIDEIYALERKIVPQTGSIEILIETSRGQVTLSALQTKNLLGLPSQFFRIYSFKDKKGQLNIQILGGLAGYKDRVNHDSVLNLIDSLDGMKTYEGQPYDALLKDLYPNSYVARL